MATTVTLKPNAIDLSGSTSGTTTLQATAVAGTTTITLPAATDTLVGKATTDTLTNKTLTTPVISTISNTGTLTLPTSTDTLVGRATTDTLTNKTLTTPVISSLSSASATALTLQSAGTTAITVDTSQRVLIGTTSASYGKLVISGASADVAMQIADTASTTAGIGFNGSGSTNGVGAPTGTLYFGQYNGFPMVFTTNNAERMRIDSSGNVGIGTTSPAGRLTISGGGSYAPSLSGQMLTLRSGAGVAYMTMGNGDGADSYRYIGGASATQLFGKVTDAGAVTEHMRIDSGGILFVGRTSDTDNAGLTLEGSGFIRANRDGGTVMVVNRNTNDGILISLRKASAEEGTISVSGTTVSYNGGHLSRYAQTTTAKDESLVKGTVLSNLDAMNVYIAPTTYWTEEDELPEGVNVGDVKVETHEVANEQLNKVKVSDVEGDANVAGVFVNWSYDEQHSVDEINMAMTGDMIIRIAQGVTVQRGDLLMSAGDGTAKAQGDDIVRSKTIAKVTSNHVTCTYADGSYCVPCVLMAC